MNRDSGSQMNLIFEDHQTDVLKPLDTFWNRKTRVDSDSYSKSKEKQLLSTYFFSRNLCSLVIDFMCFKLLVVSFLFVASLGTQAVSSGPASSIAIHENLANGNEQWAWVIRCGKLVGQKHFNFN